jgi:hypothetical protein
LGSRALREGSVGNSFLSSRAPVNSACALLLLFVEEAEAVAVAEAGDRGLNNPTRGFTLARLELISISPSKSL